MHYESCKFYVRCELVGTKWKISSVEACLSCPASTASSLIHWYAAAPCCSPFPPNCNSSFDGCRKEGTSICMPALLQVKPLRNSRKQFLSVLVFPKFFGVCVCCGFMSDRGFLWMHGNPHTVPDINNVINPASSRHQCSIQFGALLGLLRPAQNIASIPYLELWRNIKATLICVWNSLTVQAETSKMGLYKPTNKGVNKCSKDMQTWQRLE